MWIGRKNNAVKKQDMKRHIWHSLNSSDINWIIVGRSYLVRRIKMESFGERFYRVTLVQLLLRNSEGLKRKRIRSNINLFSAIRLRFGRCSFFLNEIVFRKILRKPPQNYLNIIWRNGMIFSISNPKSNGTFTASIENCYSYTSIILSERLWTIVHSRISKNANREMQKASLGVTTKRLIQLISA